MTTTQPIAGNQFFKEVFNQAAQLPILQVEDLEIGTATANFLEVVRTNVSLGLTPSTDPSNIKNQLDGFGHILLAQETAPTVALTDWTVGTTVVLEGGATDTSGRVRISGTRRSSDAICTLTFNRPFPNDTTPVVILTPLDKRVAEVESSDDGWYVTATPQSFTVSVRGAFIVPPVDAVFLFAYYVVCPTLHS